MRAIPAWFVLACACPLALASEPPLRHVRISADNAAALAQQLLQAGHDVLEPSISDSSFELITSQDAVQRLEAQGLAVELLAVGRPFADIQAERQGAVAGDPPPGYLNLAEIEARMMDVADTFPSICQFVDLTVMLGAPPTTQGRHLYALKISDNVADEENEPQFLLVSTHHAREIVTPVIALHAIDQLTTQYGIDPALTAAVDNYEIWVAPVWNPDGYNWVFTGDNLWRKNRTIFPGGVGCDLNRNYPFGWDNLCSGSSIPSNDTYKGPSAASEAETQTMQAFNDARHFTKIIDYHSHGRETLYAYACPTHPFGTWMQGEAIAISQASGYGTRNRPPSADGEQYETAVVEHGAYGFLTETHTEFQPSYASAQAEAAAVFGGVRYMLQRAVPLSGRVTNNLNGDPVETEVELLNVAFPNGERHHSEPGFGRYHVFAPAGPYTVRFSAPGFIPATRNVNITANTATVLDVGLTPEVLRLSLTEAPAGLAAPGTAPRVTVQILPGTENPASARVFHRYGGGAFASTPLSPIGNNEFRATLPPVQCGDEPEFYIEATSDLGTTTTLPHGAPGNLLSFDVGVMQAAFADNFEQNLGWTTEILGATAGQWQRGVPVNDPNWDYDPASDSDGSGQCFLTQNEFGNTDVDNGSVRLTSPVIDMSADGLLISYDYYLFLTNADGADRLLVEANNNGGVGTWAPLVAHATHGGLTWRNHQLTAADLIAAGVPPTANMRLRFTANDGGAQSIVESGLDALSVTGVFCEGGCEPCDANCDGAVDAFDVEPFINVLLGGAGCSACAGDANGDGAVDAFDVEPFINCLVGP